MKLIVLLFLSVFVFSCSSPETKSKPQYQTKEQNDAFKALNKLQVNMDIVGRLYSTFPNINKPCAHTDTSYVITQADLSDAMQAFVSTFCTQLPDEQKVQLALASVKVQDDYRVLHCAPYSPDKYHSKQLPRTGKWILPNLQGRTDLILVW